jgi:hypothetical protein
MKFVDGLMIHSGDFVNYYVDTSVHHVLLRHGVLGTKVKIMVPWEPNGKIFPKKPLPDHVSIVKPKDEILLTTPISELKSGKAEPFAVPKPAPTAQQGLSGSCNWSMDEPPQRHLIKSCTKTKKKSFRIQCQWKYMTALKIVHNDYLFKFLFLL